jgi:hypothetical protein
MIINSLNYSIEHWLHLQQIEENRESHLLKAFNLIIKNGYICEFGVFKGSTINLIAENFPSHIIHGFDSFEGLPEDWILTNEELVQKNIKHRKGTFSLRKLPNLKSNVMLHKGFFEESLPVWYKNQPNNFFISLLHIDCDLYSSSKFVLNFLNSNIKKNTIIVFDDFYRWDNPKIYKFWEEGEYKALKEWIEIYDREIEIVSRSRFGWQTAIKVVK